MDVDQEAVEQEEISQDDAIEIEGAADEVEGAEIEDGEQDAEEGSEDDAITVTIGDEEPEEEQAAAPDWVRDLRKKNREDQRRIKELEAKLSAQESPQKQALGAKPRLEDFDYDADKFEVELESWYERKRVADDEAAQVESAQKAQELAWNAKLDAYNQKKEELKVPDYEDAELAVQDLFDVTQQGIMLQGADNPALITYALGKNDKKAKELAGIKDPVQFAFAVAKLETQLKVSGKKKPPAPEKKVSGAANSAGAVDSTLEQLRAEAAKTGDYTKVSAYKRKKRAS